MQIVRTTSPLPVGGGVAVEAGRQSCGTGGIGITGGSRVNGLCCTRIWWWWQDRSFNGVAVTPPHILTMAAVLLKEGCEQRNYPCDQLLVVGILDKSNVGLISIRFDRSSSCCACVLRGVHMLGLSLHVMLLYAC